MIEAIPTKKDIRAISKDIETSIDETIFEPLSSYDTVEGVLSNVTYEGGRIKGKLSLASIK
ncbi:hypothetical protein DRO61_12195, partial [Candidatus Bathyarchaeota archaeon]